MFGLDRSHVRSGEKRSGVLRCAGRLSRFRGRFTFARIGVDASRIVLALLLGAASVIGAGCSSGAPERPLFVGAKTVLVRMSEYRFEYDPQVPAGRVKFLFVNSGKTVHAPVLQPLGDDVPPIGVQLGGSNRIAVEPFASVLPRGPGDTGAIVVDLAKDRRYAFICTSADGGPSHASRGMSSEFRTPRS